MAGQYQPIPSPSQVESVMKIYWPANTFSNRVELIMKIYWLANTVLNGVESISVIDWPINIYFLNILEYSMES